MAARYLEYSAMKSALSFLPDKTPLVVEGSPAGCEEIPDDLRDGRLLEGAGQDRRELVRSVRARMLAEKRLDREDGPGPGTAPRPIGHVLSSRHVVTQASRCGRGP